MKLKMCCLLVWTASSAFAWGCKGHQIVALTAWHLMGDRAKGMIENLESAFPPDPGLKHFCQGDGALLRIARVATWADDFRGVDKSTANWHFLDVPIGQSVGDGKGFCADGCITNALSEQYAKLQKSPNANTAENSAALRFVIHFLGDMHQPLHISDNHDRGGNCVPIQFLTRKPSLSHGAFSPELHSVWDDDLVASAMADLKAKDVNATSKYLAKLAKDNQTAWSAGTPPEWMKVTHDIAERIAYGKLTATPAIKDLVPAIAGPATLKSCSENHFDRGLLDKHLRVSASYVKEAVPEVQQQLAKAGLRLANMLNALWP